MHAVNKLNISLDIGLEVKANFAIGFLCEKNAHVLCEFTTVKLSLKKDQHDSFFVLKGYVDVSPAQTSFGLPNLRKYYPRYKQAFEGQQVKEDKVEIKKPVNYHLSSALASHGFLAVKGKSMGYFDFGGYKDDPEVQEEFKDKEVNFGRAKGAFDVIKPAGKGIYRYKPKDTKERKNWRMDFQRDGNVEVHDDEENAKSVKRYVAFQRG